MSKAKEFKEMIEDTGDFENLPVSIRRLLSSYKNNIVKVEREASRIWITVHSSFLKRDELKEIINSNNFIGINATGLAHIEFIFSISYK